jgi:hypothetical protein
MKRLIGRLFPALLLATMLIPLAAADKSPDASPEAIRKTAQACADALLKGDYPTFVQYTHPKIVAMVGGSDKMVEMIKSGMEAMKAQGMSIDTYKIEAPTGTIASGDDLTAIVPTLLQMSNKSQKITQKSYLLAISSDNGKHWTFVDGAGLNDETLKTVIPNPPKELKLPAKTEPVIEKK